MVFSTNQQACNAKPYLSTCLCGTKLWNSMDSGGAVSVRWYGLEGVEGCLDSAGTEKHGDYLLIMWVAKRVYAVGMFRVFMYLSSEN